METIAWVLLSLLGWVLLYLVSCFCGKSLPAEWHCRIITFLHAMTVVSLSAWSLLVQGPWPFTDPGGPNTHLHTVTVILCLGYFLFDFLWCLYHKTEGPFMIFHHMLSITGNFFTLFYGMYGTELVATIFGTEITNPFLQLRWFLRKTGRGTTLFAELNDFFFMFLFGAMRIVVGGFLLYSYLNHPRPDWLGRLGGISIYVVGWIFWVMIVKYAVKKYSKMYRDFVVRNSQIESHAKSNGNGEVSRGSENSSGSIGEQDINENKEVVHRNGFAVK